MVKVTYIEHNGTTHTVEGEAGQTVMETAIKHGIPGIIAECGGACSCATCHVYVDEAWKEKTGSPSPMEEDMLDFAFFQRCITVGGPNNVHFESLPGDCKCLDLTGPAGVKDNSVDQYDLVMMLGCASGAEIPADASCDDPPAQ